MLEYNCLQYTAFLLWKGHSGASKILMVNMGSVIEKLTFKELLHLELIKLGNVIQLLQKKEKERKKERQVKLSF
jgi:hypothetical protein